MPEAPGFLPPERPQLRLLAHLLCPILSKGHRRISRCTLRIIKLSIKINGASKACIGRRPNRIRITTTISMAVIPTSQRNCEVVSAYLFLMLRNPHQASNASNSGASSRIISMRVMCSLVRAGKISTGKISARKIMAGKKLTATLKTQRLSWWPSRPTLGCAPLLKSRSAVSPPLAYTATAFNRSRNCPALP